MQALHLTADLYQCRCDAAWLADAPRLGAWCLATLRAAGIEPTAHLWQAEPADGSDADGAVVTLLMPAAQLWLRTWPAQRGVGIDLYAGAAGGPGPETARHLMDALIAHFQPAWTEQRSLDRGDGQ